MLGRAWLSAFVLLFLAGCGDKTITLTYAAAGPPASPPTSARAVTIFAFRDARGDEGDGHPNRVGGIYGGYGNRLSKVWTPRPWMPTLVNALATGFQSRGVPAEVAADREFSAGDPAITGCALGGELRNFSTEARFTNSAHISAIVRLWEADGTLAVEKEISQRGRSEYGGGGVFTSVDDLQRIMNDALSQFVQRVTTDPDITARLTGAKRPE
jgi:hypothetical protein